MVALGIYKMNNQFYLLQEALLYESVRLPFIKNPSHLYKYLSTITYGYIDLNGNVITPSKTKDLWDDDNYFIKHYRSQSPEQTVKNKIGICVDKTELTRTILSENLKIDNNVYYLELNKFHDGHHFISYVLDDKHYWIESSWDDMHNGIHEFNSEEALIKHVSKEFKKQSYGKGSGFVNLISSPTPPGLNINQLIKLGRQGKRVMNI